MDQDRLDERRIRRNQVDENQGGSRYCQPCQSLDRVASLSCAQNRASTLLSGIARCVGSPPRSDLHAPLLGQAHGSQSRPGNQPPTERLEGGGGGGWLCGERRSSAARGGRPADCRRGRGTQPRDGATRRTVDTCPGRKGEAGRRRGWAERDDCVQHWQSRDIGA
jgi:hypothetical protein